MKVSYLYAKLMNRLKGTAILNSTIHSTSKVYPGCNIVDVKMDRYSYCSHDCQIVCCDIGAFCSISDHVFIGGAEHPIGWVSTSPVLQNVQCGRDHGLADLVDGIGFAQQDRVAADGADHIHQDIKCFERFSLP